MNYERKNELRDKFKWFTDMFLLSLLFLLTSIPVVTLGASIAALYRSITKTQFHEEGYLFRTYWAAWKDNLKMGILLTVLLLIYLLAAGYGIWYLAALTAEGRLNAVFFGVSWIALLPPAVIFPWACQYISAFNDRLSNIIRNSFTIGLTNLKLTLLQIILIAVIIFCMLFLLPLVPFLLASLSFKVFRKTEPVLLQIAKKTEGYDEKAWYAR